MIYCFMRNPCPVQLQKRKQRSDKNNFPNALQDQLVETYQEQK